MWRTQYAEDGNIVLFKLILISFKNYSILVYVMWKRNPLFSGVNGNICQKYEELALQNDEALKPDISIQELSQNWYCDRTYVGYDDHIPSYYTERRL